MSQLPAPVVALVVALTMRIAALPAVGAVNASLSVVNTGDAAVPVTSTVYVPFAANDGAKPVRFVVLPACRTVSCGFVALTFVQLLALPNAMLPLPVPTVPFCATSRLRLLVVALKKRTVVVLLVVPVGVLLSSSLHALRAAAVASASMAAVMLRGCTGPPYIRKRTDPGVRCLVRVPHAHHRDVRNPACSQGAVHRRRSSAMIHARPGATPLAPEPVETHIEARCQPLDRGQGNRLNSQRRNAPLAALAEFGLTP